VNFHEILLEQVDFDKRRVRPNWKWSETYSGYFIVFVVSSGLPNRPSRHRRIEPSPL